jgi:branched-chain amino acid transport system substrate-binding protein
MNTFLPIVAACASLFIAAVSSAQNGSIKIVSSLPRTGSANAQTGTIVNGIKMAIAEVGGAIDGYTIEYEDWDDASPQRGNWDPTVEAQNANKAVTDPKIMGYIGTFNSGAAKISMPELNRAGLVMISPANTYSGLTKPGLGEANEPAIYRPSGKINYFRVVPTDDLQGAVAAEFVSASGAKRAFVLHDRELYGKGIAEVFARRAKELGMEIAGLEGIDTKAANYKSLAQKVKFSKSDAAFFGGTTQTNAGQVAKDLRSAGFTGMLVVPDGCCEEAFIQAAGAKNLEGNTFVTFGGLPPAELTGRGAQFRDGYRKMYNSDPEAYAVYGYECARVLLDAIRRASAKDRAGVLQAVAQTKDFDGALGNWSFDANGDTTNRVMSINAIKDGKFVFVKRVGDAAAAGAAKGSETPSDALSR